MATTTKSTITTKRKAIALPKGYINGTILSPDKNGYYRVELHKGNFHKVTNCNTKDKALAKLRGWLDAYDEEERVSYLRSIGLEPPKPEPEPPKMATPTLEDWCRKVLGTKTMTADGKPMANTTKNSYRLSLEAWVYPKDRPHCMAGKLHLEELSEKTLHAALVEPMLDADLSRSTILNVKAALVWALEWAKIGHIMERNPAREMISKMELPAKKPLSSKDFVSLEGYRKLVAALKEEDHWLYGPIVWGRMVGCRQSEMQGLRRADIDYKSGRWTPGSILWRTSDGLASSSLKTAKSGEAIALEEAVMDFLRGLKRSGTDFTFLDGNGKPISQYAVCDAVREVCDRLKITNEDGTNATYRSICRRGWATDALASGIPMAVIAKRLRNSIPEKYAKDARTEEDIKREADADRLLYAAVGAYQSA